MLEKPTAENEITHINQITILAYLKDVKGFNPISDGICVITDFPLKSQSRNGYDSHAKVFNDANDFSNWINQHTGVKTRALGSSVFWEEVSDDSRIKLIKYSFFHTTEQLHCSVYSRKALGYPVQKAS